MNGLKPGFVSLHLSVGLKAVFMVSILAFASACDLVVEKKSGPHIPTDNPGDTVNLVEGLAGGPSDNTHRMTLARRQKQKCSEDLSCTQIDDGLIEYTYSTAGRLDTALERKFGFGSEVESQRQYYYGGSGANRLDKVAVRITGNFHTLHDYTYDDEDDPSDFLADEDDADDGNRNNDNDGYNAQNNLSRPKLRKEYICDIDVADASTETCDRLSAREVISYIYYEDGRLFRKEFDTDNDTEIEHQKIYRYRDGLLDHVDTDNFYDGVIEERYVYDREDWEANDNNNDEELRVFIDNGFNSSSTRGIDRTVSYRLDSDNLVRQECYYRGEWRNRTGDEVSGDCTGSSTQGYHWKFNWEQADCWAGGLDDIDPEARAIDYLCKQGE